MHSSSRFADRVVSPPPPEAPTPTPARVWGDQWLRVSEKVMKGLNHQLTNRVSSLTGLLGIVEPGEPLDDQIVGAFRHELTRLDSLMRLYRLLPAEPTAAPEAVRLQDILPLVLELHTHHTDLRSVRCELVIVAETEAEPVCLRPSALLRSLLVLLESAAGHARRAGSDRPIRMELHGAGSDVTIVVEGPSPTAEAIFAGGGSLVDAVRNALAGADGSVDARRGEGSDGAPTIRYELTLPTLREVRRRERARAAAGAAAD